MPETYRRVVLKPPGMAGDAAARLAERLAAAVELQQQLASQTPHVLQFTGGLEQDGHSFFVDHEPARPLAVAALFSSDSPPMEEAVLLRIAVALADALRVAHGTGRPQPTVHGGICGGVVLETAEGVSKVTDFGFAPAICAALGVESYLELAVGPQPEGAQNLPCTCLWEVLSSEVITRDDRICGFIDPEKYGSQMLATFEAGSDVISAGVLLHLLAEHRHPMLQDPEDHRMVVTAESMAFFPYNGARRKALRESTDPKVQCWCELVARMLSRLPKDRPSAGEICALLAKVGVRPVDASENLRRALRDAESLLKAGQWTKAQDAISRVSTAETAPADVLEQARALAAQCQACRLLDQATETFQSKDWRSAREPIAQLSAMATLPASAAQQFHKLSESWSRNLRAQEELDSIATASRQAPGNDPQGAVPAVQGWIDRTTKLLTDNALVQPLREDLRRLVEELSLRRADLLAKVKEIEAQQAAVQEWFNALEAAWDQERWPDVEALRNKRPLTPHWPKGVKDHTEELERLYGEVQAALIHLQNFRKALDDNNLDAAESFNASPPRLTRPPPKLRADLDALVGRFQAAKAKAADHARAAHWIENVREAVASKNWTLASRRLGERPSLGHWPGNVLEQEKALRSQVERELAEQERQRLQVESWLRSTDQAAGQGDFARALTLLNTPPADSASMLRLRQEEVTKRVQTYTAALHEQRRRQLERATETARNLAAAFVRELIVQDLPELLAPSVVDAQLGTVQWTSEPTPTHGRADLKITVRPLAERGQDTASSQPLSFELGVDPPRIRDQDGKARKALGTHLAKVVRGAQQAPATNLQTPLRKGLFPSATVTVKPLKSETQALAAVSLLGTDVPEARMDDLRLTWDPANLVWVFDDLPGLTRGATDLTVGKARELVKPHLLKESEALRRYASVLEVNLLPPAIADPSLTPTSLTLECRLTLRPRGHEPHALPPVTVVCRQLGTITLAAGLPQAEGELRRLVVIAQRSSQAALERDFRARLESTSARARLGVLTRRITRPVYQIQFEFQPKHCDKLTVTAPWNVDTFSFDPPETALQQIEAFLKQLAEAPVAERRAFKLRKPGRRAYALAGVAALVFLVVTLPFVRRSETDHKTSNSSLTTNNTDIGNVSTNDNAGARGTDAVASRDASDEDTSADRSSTDDAPPDNRGDDRRLTDDSNVEDMAPAKAQRSAEEAVAVVRTVLAASKHLRSHTPELIQTSGTAAQGQVPVTISFPGLKDPVRRVTLSLDPDQASPLSESERRSLEEAARSSDAVLEEAPKTFAAEINRRMAANLDSRFVGTDRLDARIPSDPHWTPDGDRTAWSAKNVPVSVVFRPARPTDEGATDGGAEVTELASIDVDLTVRNELVALSQPERIVALKDSVVESLRRRQMDSLAAHLAEVNKRLEGLGASVAAQPAILESLEGSVEVTVRSARLAPRGYALQWLPDRLLFASESSTAVLDELLGVHQALSVVETLVKERQDHWIRQVYPETSSELLVEVEAPRDTTWNLALVAPWAAEDVLRLQDPDDLLPLSVTIPGSWNQGDLAAALQSLEPPPYWDMVRQYVLLAARPYLLETGDDLRSFADAIETEAGRLKVTQAKAIVDYLRSDPPPSLIIPQIALAGDGSPEPRGLAATTRPGAPAGPTMKLTVTARLGLDATRAAQLDATLDQTTVLRLEGAISSLMAERAPGETAAQTAATCTLTLHPKTRGQSGAAMQWSDLAAVIDLFSPVSGEVEELAALLIALPQRGKLEADLYAALGGTTPGDGQAVLLPAERAAELLKRIWLTKGMDQAAAERQSADLAALSVARQEAFNRLNVRGFSKGRSVIPTIFAEYFCGPKACFAIAWSVKLPQRPEPGTIQEGPFLVHLCANSTLSEAFQTQNGIGQLLLDPLLNNLSRASAAEFNSPFDLTLGIVLATDDRVNQVDLATVTFSTRTSRFKPRDSSRPDATNYEFVDRSWNSLAALQAEALRNGVCDYVLVPRFPSDPVPGTRALPAQRTWALSQLDNALQPAPGR